MNITIHPTRRIVELKVDGAIVPARIWEGTTDKGTPVHAFVTRISPTIPEPLPAEVAREFGDALKECAPPSVEVAAIPLRLII